MHAFFAGPRPRLFAHRGASGEAPENTLRAFELGLARGAPYVETDARLTRDGEVVLLHDADLDRTTEGSGAVSEWTFRELDRLDAGYRFSPDGRHFPFRGLGLRVPRLRELLDAFPQARVNVEIKGTDPSLAEPVVEVIRAARAEHRALLAAADDAVLDRVLHLDPGTAIGSSTGDVIALIRAVVEGRLASHVPRGHALQVPPAFMGRALVTPELIAAAHAKGLEVHVWMVDEPAEMQRLLALGVDGLMSDFPDRLVRAARIG
jgi:glycerophosphoryl diester phosphodiesterase